MNCVVTGCKSIPTHTNKDSQPICWMHHKVYDRKLGEEEFKMPTDPLIESNQLLKDAEKLFKLVFETIYKKNGDYALADKPYSNFENSAQRVGITVEQGILVRFNDKVERLCNLLRQNKTARVMEETIEDTICDAIGYLAILYAFRVGRLVAEDDRK